MNTRSSVREFWVGLVVIVAVAGLIALVGLASDGPGSWRPGEPSTLSFATAKASESAARARGRTGHWQRGRCRPGGSRRDASARVRLSLPASLVKKLRQDVKVTIVPGLTGMSHVNIVSTGKMAVGLVPGSRSRAWRPRSSTRSSSRLAWVRSSGIT